MLLFEISGKAWHVWKILALATPECQSKTDGYCQILRQWARANIHARSGKPMQRSPSGENSSKDVKKAQEAGAFCNEPDRRKHRAGRRDHAGQVASRAHIRHHRPFGSRPPVRQSGNFKHNHIESRCNEFRDQWTSCAGRDLDRRLAHRDQPHRPRQHARAGTAARTRRFRTGRHRDVGIGHRARGHRTLACAGAGAAQGSDRRALQHRPDAQHDEIRGGRPDRARAQFSGRRLLR